MNQEPAFTLPVTLSDGTQVQVIGATPLDTFIAQMELEDIMPATITRGAFDLFFVDRPGLQQLLAPTWVKPEGPDRDLP